MGFFDKIKKGLAKTRAAFGSMLEDVFSNADAIDEDFYEELEETLILADMGMDTVNKLMEELRYRVRNRGLTTKDHVRFNLKLILQLVVKLGLDRFTNYLKGDALSIMIGQILLRLPIIAITVFSWKRLRKATPEAAFFLAMLLLDLLAAQIVSIAKYALRISYFFACFSVLLVPYLFKYQKSRFEKTAVTIGLTGFYALYWVYFYVYTGAHETYPYYFRFMRF